MKVLKCNIYFQLPDDFEGDTNEAFEELIKYRKSKGYSNYKKRSNKDMGFSKDDKEILKASNGILFDAFWKSHLQGYKMAGKVYLGKYENNKWEELK